MSLQDPISDMLTRIRNGHMASKTKVNMPFSKLKKSVLTVLQDEGYIEGFNVESVEDSKAKKNLIVDLKYYKGKPVIAKLQRVSRPGLRRYESSATLPKIIGGLGVSIISTSQGVMSDRNARKLGIGGEVLCEVQ